MIPEWVEEQLAERKTTIDEFIVNLDIVGFSLYDKKNIFDIFKLLFIPKKNNKKKTVIGIGKNLIQLLEETDVIDFLHDDTDFIRLLDELILNDNLIPLSSVFSFIESYDKKFHTYLSQRISSHITYKQRKNKANSKH